MVKETLPLIYFKPTSSSLQTFFFPHSAAGLEMLFRVSIKRGLKKNLWLLPPGVIRGNRVHHITGCPCPPHLLGLTPRHLTPPQVKMAKKGKGFEWVQAIKAVTMVQLESLEKSLSAS